MADFWNTLRKTDAPQPTPRGKGVFASGAKGQQPGKPSAQSPQVALQTSGDLRLRIDRPPLPRKLAVDAEGDHSPSRAPSVHSGDGELDDFSLELENDSVRVFVRVRPATEQEEKHEKHETCLSVVGSKSLQLTIKDKQRDTHKFNFDQVMPENTTQQDMFDMAGVPAVDNCIAGYNSSLFAYGQTGSGKTYTVLGQLNDAEKKGLAPRVFDYLYQKIMDQENGKGPDKVKYNCRCAFLEIYNETIADLLNPASQNLPIREDPEKGPYVEGLFEPNALNAEEIIQYLQRGAENRHTGETRLNRESSRSHSVFMCTVEKTVTSNGISKCVYAKLNLVDLAGSERIASGAHGGSNATGDHFKEACHINKSLTALGRVTTELLKSQKSGGNGHVPYRDSKLTFLLQSSLGGNAKTLIIANVSPSSVCAHETLSTLRFARQTKHIRNDARINWTVQGDRIAMQREIERLRMEIASLRSGVNDPLVAANEDLTRKLDEERQMREKLQGERERLQDMYSQARRENKVLDQRLVAINGQYEQNGVQAIMRMVSELESVNSAYMTKTLETAQAELEFKQLQLEAEQDVIKVLQVQLHDSSSQVASLDSQLEALLKEKSELEDTCAELASNFSDQKEALAAAGADLQQLRASRDELDQQLTDERAAKAQVSEELLQAQAELASASARGVEQQACLEEKEAALTQERACSQDAQHKLEAALAEIEQLKANLAQAQQQLIQVEEEGSTSRGALSEQLASLTSQLAATEARAVDSEASVVQLRAELQGARECMAERDQQLAELQQQVEAKTTECCAAHDKLAGTEAELAEQRSGRATAEAEATDLAQRLAALKAQLEAGEECSSKQAAQLDSMRQEAQELREQLEAKSSELADVSTQAAKLREEVEQLQARAKSMEESAEQQGKERVEVESQLQEARSTVEQLKEQVEAARGDHSMTASRASELGASLTAAQDRCSALEQELEESKKVVAQQSADKQEQDRAVSQLEARVAELSKQLTGEQTAVSSLNEEVARRDREIEDLRQQVDDEQFRRLSSLRELSESAASTQRQIADLESQHLTEVQQLKGEMDRLKADLIAKDHELVSNNFALKKDIDRLHAALDQSKREVVSAKAAQEQMASMHSGTINEMNDRLSTQRDRYNELTKKHDGVKQQLDAVLRELESWKTKYERLDVAMADVTRLIRFARNPPDSARSSLIMARSDHVGGQAMSGSRSGLPSALGGPMPLRISESPAASPRASARYSAASPLGSKVGSMVPSLSTRNGAHDDEDEVCSRAMPDIMSPGDQLPVPALDS